MGRSVFVFSCVLLVLFAFFQIANGQTIINEYAKVTSIPACNPCAGNCDELVVDDASNFSVGDVIMIMQVKGAQVELAATPDFGDVLDYGAAGFHEKNTINAIVGNTIYLASGTAGAYDATSSLQIISVPQFPTGYAVPAGGLTCPAWDGNKGGVIALDVTGTLTLSGDIDARGKGLRGAQNPNTNDNEVFCAMKDKGDYYFDLADIQVAGRKGEGIAEWILPAYELGRGKWASGGGGGHNHNAGGGGGSNMGAGGLGGDEYGGLACSSVGIRNGIGGQALDYMGGLRMFLGGGGGGGQENNNRGNSGGDGGGIIIISADDVEGNGFWIRADGNKGINWAGVQDGPGGNDGGGGGGAGGSIKLQVVTFGSTPLTVSAEGADGGDLTANIHGPGGGGGGGLICSSVTTFPGNVSVDVTGGQGGTTGNGSNWGTEPGEDGIVNSGCTPPSVPPLAFSVNLGSDIKLCSPPEHTFNSRLDATNNFVWYQDGVILNGETGPTLTVNGPGTYVVETGATGCPTVYDTVEVTSDAAAPTNADFCGVNQSIALGITGPGEYAWYDAPTDGNKIGSGSTFNTPPISADATYYVEDTTVFNYIVGEPASGHGLSGGAGALEAKQQYVEFEAFDEFTIDAITFAFKAWWLGPTDRFQVTVTIVDDNNNPVGSMSNNNIDPGRTGSIPGPNIVYTRVPIGIQIPATGNYKMQVTANATNPIHWFQNGRQLPYTDPAGEVIRIWSTHADYMPFFDWQGNLVPASYAPNSFPGFFDWEISAGLACDRVPVNANYDCPITCIAPSAAPVITPSSLDVCGAVNDTLKATLESGFYYQWYLNGTVIVAESGVDDTMCIATQAGDYFVRIVDDVSNLLDNNCYEESNTVTINSNPVVVPTITLTEDQNNVCEGTTINFTTGVTNEGASPSYSWAINGVDLGITANSISTDTLSNGSIVRVKLISDANCAQPDSAVSSVIMQVNPNVTPSLEMAPDQNGVCAGTMINFSLSNIQNEGATPSYAWSINGTTVGGNVTTLSTDTLTDGAFVEVELTSNAVCTNPLTARDTVTMSVGTTVVPSVTITHDLDTICANESVVFSVSDSSGGGNNPSFAWTINGVSVGGDVAEITTDTFTINPAIEVTMTSSSSCASPATALDNDVIEVMPILTPTVVLTEDQNNVCEGSMINFTTVVTNEGTPVYTWTANGVDLGVTSGSISTDTLTNGAVIEVTLTSDEQCVSSATAVDNVTMQLIPDVTPGFDMAPDLNNQCDGTMITFNVTNEVNMGLAPVYAWSVNGISVGGSTSTISTDTLSSGALVQVEVTSAETCVLVASATKDTLMQVTPTVIPSVSVAHDIDNICAGTMVTFSVTDSTGGGDNPSFSWSINGISVSGDINEILTDTLTLSPLVEVEMSSNDACAQPTSALANVGVTILAVETPRVVIAPDVNDVCEGTMITINVTDSTGASNADYVWEINGVEVANGNVEFIQTDTLTGTAVVNVTMNTNNACASPASVSDDTLLTLLPPLTPSITIQESTANICLGDQVDFSILTEQNEGLSPAYEWFLLDASANTTTSVGNGLTYSSLTLDDQDSVYLELTSDENCLTQLTTESNGVVMTVANNVSPSVVINLPSAICIGDLVAFTATPDFGGSAPIYQWYHVDASNSFLITPVGTNSSTYSTGTLEKGDSIYVELTSNAGCIDPLVSNMVRSNSVGINVNTMPQAPVNLTGDITLCQGAVGNYMVDPIMGAIDQIWSAPLGVFNSVGQNTNAFQMDFGNLVGTYYIKVIGENECGFGPADSLEVTIQSTIIPNVTIGASSLSICTNENIDFEVLTNTNGGSSPLYTWYKNAGSVLQGQSLDSTFSSTSIVNGDSVYVVLTSNEACADPLTAISNKLPITVTDIPSPSIVIDQLNMDVCEGETITLTSTVIDGGANPSYQWSINGISVVGNQQLLLIDTLTQDALISLEMVPDFSCWSSGNVQSIVTTNITVYEVPQSVITGFNSLCDGDGLELSPVNVYPSASYKWSKSGNVVSMNMNLMVLESGRYQLEIINPGNCSDVSSDHDVSIIKPRIDAGEDQTIELGEAALLEASGNVSVYQWDNVDLVSVIMDKTTLATPQETTLFTVSGELQGCPTEDTVRVYVQNPVFIPNIFTPNGDGDNDVWEIEGIEDYPDFLLHVYNRWGDKVFFTHDEYVPWNGERDGLGMPVATYYYVFEHDFGDEHPLIGSVTILR